MILILTDIEHTKITQQLPDLSAKIIWHFNESKYTHTQKKHKQRIQFVFQNFSRFCRFIYVFLLTLNNLPVTDVETRNYIWMWKNKLFFLFNLTLNRNSIPFHLVTILIWLVPVHFMCNSHVKMKHNATNFYDLNNPFCFVLFLLFCSFAILRFRLCSIIFLLCYFLFFFIILVWFSFDEQKTVRPSTVHKLITARRVRDWSEVHKIRLSWRRCTLWYRRSTHQYNVKIYS